MYELSILDILLAPIYILLFIYFARARQEKNVAEKPYYEYYSRGLYLKFIGGIGLCFVYLYYYKGGDTINYMDDTRIFLRLASNNFEGFWNIFTGEVSKISFSVFNKEIGYPTYNYYKKEEWQLIRLLTPFSFVGLSLYLPTTAIVAYVSYFGNFKLYEVFCDRYPHLYKQLALPLLFIPSCAFWGSGMMKDTFTFSAIGWFVYSFYFFFIKKEYKRKYLVWLVIAAIVMIRIKAYIFIALLPGALLWLNFERLKAIQSAFIRILALPVIVSVLLLGGAFLLTRLGSSLGKYSSVDKVLENAVVTQKDLKRAEYKGSSFDIGEFDASIGGVLSKAPVAITAGLYRPFVWEARNPVMLLSGLQNFIFLILTIRIIFTVGLLGFFRALSADPLLLFSIIFSLFFAFAVGLTTSNFGSLVRYKIPAEPFYLATMIIMYYSTQAKIKEQQEEFREGEVIDKSHLEKDTGFIIR